MNATALLSNCVHSYANPGKVFSPLFSVTINLVFPLEITVVEQIKAWEKGEI